MHWLFADIEGFVEKQGFLWCLFRLASSENVLSAWSAPMLLLESAAIAKNYE